MDESDFYSTLKPEGQWLIDRGVTGEALLIKTEKIFKRVRKGKKVYDHRIYIEYKDKARNIKVSKVIDRCTCCPKPPYVLTTCYSPFIMNGLGDNPKNIKMPIIYLGDNRKIVSFDVNYILKARSERTKRTLEKYQLE